jgi:hypothetical protein
VPRFSPSTSVSLANLHSTNCSTITIIYHLRLLEAAEPNGLNPTLLLLLLLLIIIIIIIIISIIPVPDIFQVVSNVIHHILGEFPELFALHDGL